MRSFIHILIKHITIIVIIVGSREVVEMKLCIAKVNQITLGSGSNVLATCIGDSVLDRGFKGGIVRADISVPVDVGMRKIPLNNFDTATKQSIHPCERSMVAMVMRDNSGINFLNVVSIQVIDKGSGVGIITKVIGDTDILIMEDNAKAITTFGVFGRQVGSRKESNFQVLAKVIKSPNDVKNISTNVTNIIVDVVDIALCGFHAVFEILNIKAILVNLIIQFSKDGDIDEVSKCTVLCHFVQFVIHKFLEVLAIKIVIDILNQLVKGIGHTVRAFDYLIQFSDKFAQQFIVRQTIVINGRQNFLTPKTEIRDFVKHSNLLSPKVKE
nr:MAG: hypothetical protein [Bacteriophage sp.]